MNTKNPPTRVCEHCQQNFTISDEELALYKKVGLKVPGLCCECRWKKYLSFAPFGKFRKGKSDLSGENFITVLPVNARFPIYASHEWWGDGWDPISFGQEYNSQKSFFTQLKELQEKVPRPHQGGKNNFNCDWCEDVWESKNCYLSRALFKCENLSYGYRVLTSKDSFDLVYCFDLQRSYNCLFCHNSFNLNFSENSKDCVDSNFLFDCRNCQNCTMSWNLRNKRYCIRNVQYTKEEYEKELAKFNFGSYENIVILKEEFERILKNEAVHRENFNIKTTNSTGNYMTNCDKCINVFSWENSQNCQNCIRGLNSKDSIDQAFTWNTENSGNNGTVDGGYQIKHSAHSVGRYSEYIDNCLEVEYCFGCVGLRKKKYCILNKQYTKEEYEKLKAKIVLDMGEEYGEFFPYSMGICDYNFSASILYFPQTTKEEILREGGYWSEEDFSSEDGISSLELPDAIKDTDLGICNQALICPQTHYRFNISQSEFEFHKNNNFALPREHFDRRMLEPARKMVVSKSYPYKCFYCQKDIEAYYLPEWHYQKIACEECYKQNIA